MHSQNSIHQLAERAKGTSIRFPYPLLIILPVPVFTNTFLKLQSWTNTKENVLKWAHGSLFSLTSKCIKCWVNWIWTVSGVVPGVGFLNCAVQYSSVHFCTVAKSIHGGTSTDYYAIALVASRSQGWSRWMLMGHFTKLFYKQNGLTPACEVSSWNLVVMLRQGRDQTLGFASNPNWASSRLKEVDYKSKKKEKKHKKERIDVQWLF